MSYYDGENILKYDADYNIIIGERSNGKTFWAMKYILQKYVETGEQSAIIRRWVEDFKVQRAESFFKAVVKEGIVSELTGGEFSTVKFYSGAWWLAKYDSKLEKYVRDAEPFAYKFALSDVEHDKSTSYPKITTIVFDEFIARRYYLQDEFPLFLNTISTIVRQRNDVKIFMLGNTVDKFCLYFREMGLRHVLEMKQGDIDTYQYSGGSLKIAVEYCKSTGCSKASNKYFAFDNSTADMIINGSWELDLYPHLPVGFRYSREDVVLSYFIKYNGEVAQADIIQKENVNITYFHTKTTPIKNPDTDIIYQLNPVPQPNIFSQIISGVTKIQRKIAIYFVQDRVFFQDNAVGDYVHSFLVKSCQHSNNTTMERDI